MKRPARVSPLLRRVGGFIAGRWRVKAAGTIAVHDPATGGRLAGVPDLGAAETAEAVDAAADVLAEVPEPGVRAGWLAAIADRLLASKDQLGRLITLEQGKPLREGVAEAEYAAGFFRFYAGELPRLAPRTLDATPRGCRWTVHHRPAGVVGLITPWNFPLAMLAKKLAPALGAGCGVVVKPAEQTPLSAIALWNLLQDLRLDGLPPGLLNLVTGRPERIGGVLCTHPRVRLLSFTGSTEVGRRLMAAAAPHVKRLALELGGNAPFLVFEDADLSAAAEALIANKFRAGGQTCVCANRVYAHARVADGFAAELAARLPRLVVGPGLDPRTDVGPLIGRRGWEKVAGHVRDALDRGARRLVGDDPAPPKQDWGCYYPPTLLTGATPAMRIMREETFGPVIALASFADEAEAVAAANGTEAGLAAYLFTRDARRAARVAGQLGFGHVGVNTGSGPTPEAPFGGMKQSGFGREGGPEGLLEFCEVQTVADGTDAPASAAPARAEEERDGRRELEARIIAEVMDQGSVILQSPATEEPAAVEAEGPLHAAARAGDATRIRALVAGGEWPRVNALAGDDWSETLWEMVRSGRAPLHLAAERGHAAAVDALITAGADPTLAGRDGLTPLHLAAAGGHEAAVATLLDADAPIEAEGCEGSRPLHWAAARGRLKVASLLLARGADPASRDRVGMTPLHWAAKEGHPAVAAMLLDAGADLRARFDPRTTLAEVLDGTANDPRPDRGVGRTALHVAAAAGHLPVVRLLAERGAAVNDPDPSGKTLLHDAAEEGHEPVVAWLLAHGGNPRASDAGGATPRSWAEGRGHSGVADLLRQHEG